MVVFVWRRRVLFCVSLSGVFLFALSLLTSSEVRSSESQPRLPASSQPGDAAQATLQRPRDGVRVFVKGENASNDGVVVQLWPKNSLDLIHDSETKSQEKLVALLESVILAPKQHLPPESPVPISEKMVPCRELNVECRRFRKLLSSWPEGKPRAAFYFLTQPRRLVMLQRVLWSVDTYFNNKFHYPIIIFHEANLIPFIPEIRRYTTSDLFFQEILFQVPTFLPGPVPKDIPCLSHIGYRHMCRFHAKGVFQQPIIRGLDYYWRLDDDSLLLRDISYDVFLFMRNQNLSYGYSWRHLDSSTCTVGLWDATWRHINKTGINPGFFAEWFEPQLYYNNFEISKMSTWLSKGYADYVEYLDRLGGMYFHRWGDAPIKGIAVSLFVPKPEIHRFKDIGYSHGSYVNK